MSFILLYINISFSVKLPFLIDYHPHGEYGNISCITMGYIIPTLLRSQYCAS